MSKILKGLNEVNPNNYDSDWDYQDAVAKSGKSRSNYRSQEDDTSDADIAYSKKMYQLSQKQKRDADHDRLATGTNEGTGLDIDRSIPGRTIARISGDIKHRTGSPSGKKLPDYHPDDDYDQWSGKVGPSIHDDEEDTFDTDYTGDEDGPDGAGRLRAPPGQPHAGPALRSGPQGAARGGGAHRGAGLLPAGAAHPRWGRDHAVRGGVEQEG